MRICGKLIKLMRLIFCVWNFFLNYLQWWPGVLYTWTSMSSPMTVRDDVKVSMRINWAFTVHVYHKCMYTCTCKEPNLESKADFPGNQFLLCREDDWIPLLQSPIISLNDAIQTLYHNTWSIHTWFTAHVLGSMPFYTPTTCTCKWYCSTTEHNNGRCILGIFCCKPLSNYEYKSTQIQIHVSCSRRCETHWTFPGLCVGVVWPHSVDLHIHTIRGQELLIDVGAVSTHWALHRVGTAPVANLFIEGRRSIHMHAYMYIGDPYTCMHITVRDA